MLQNSRSQRNIRSFRALREAIDLGRRACDGRLANVLTVRLSSGISAMILDFSPPQKHVLTACLWGRPAAKPGATLPNRQHPGRERPAPRIAPALTAGNEP